MMFPDLSSFSCCFPRQPPFLAEQNGFVRDGPITAERKAKLCRRKAPVSMLKPRLLMLKLLKWKLFVGFGDMLGDFLGRYSSPQQRLKTHTILIDPVAIYTIPSGYLT